MCQTLTHRLNQAKEAALAELTELAGRLAANDAEPDSQTAGQLCQLLAITGIDPEAFSNMVDDLRRLRGVIKDYRELPKVENEAKKLEDQIAKESRELDQLLEKKERSIADKAIALESLRERITALRRQWEEVFTKWPIAWQREEWSVLESRVNELQSQITRVSNDLKALHYQLTDIDVRLEAQKHLDDHGEIVIVGDADNRRLRETKPRVAALLQERDEVARKVKTLEEALQKLRSELGAAETQKTAFQKQMLRLIEGGSA